MKLQFLLYAYNTSFKTFHLYSKQSVEEQASNQRASEQRDNGSKKHKKDSWWVDSLTHVHCILYNWNIWQTENLANRLNLSIDKNLNWRQSMENHMMIWMVHG